MTAPGMIEIPFEEYEELQRDSDILNALRGAGVDNWEGWDDAIQSLEDTE